LGSLIEMWKDDPEGRLPDRRSINMAAPNMNFAYQRYNALVMLMAGMKAGELSHARRLAGWRRFHDLSGVRIPYGRFEIQSPLALRAMVIDKLRERLLGLIFASRAAAGWRSNAPTLEDILTNRVEGSTVRCPIGKKLVARSGAGLRRGGPTRRCARPSPISGHNQAPRRRRST